MGRILAEFQTVQHQGLMDTCGIERYCSTSPIGTVRLSRLDPAFCLRTVPTKISGLRDDVDLEPTYDAVSPRWPFQPVRRRCSLQ
jgi:hypothetical protein